MKDEENDSWKNLKEAYRIYVKLRDGFVKKHLPFLLFREPFPCLRKGL